MIICSSRYYLPCSEYMYLLRTSVYILSFDVDLWTVLFVLHAGISIAQRNEAESDSNEDFYSQRQISTRLVPCQSAHTGKPVSNTSSEGTTLFLFPIFFFLICCQGLGGYMQLKKRLVPRIPKQVCLPEVCMMHVVA